MDLMSFQTLRSGLQANVAPAKRDALVQAESRLHRIIAGSNLFDDVEVELTEDRDRLVIALCTFRADASEQDVAAFLEKAWAADLRYTGWDAHSFLLDTDHVEFQAATMQAGQDHYLTVHLIAERAEAFAMETMAA